MKKSLVLSLFVFTIMFILVSNASALFIGLTDGYTLNVTGGVISGVGVSVTVSGCSGGSSNGCTGNTTSDSNGYYIVNNLNLPKLGSVSISANKSGGTGSASGTADNTQVAHVNVTLCYAPSSPSLTAVSDSHNTTAELVWTSGVDPNPFVTYDQLVFDSASPVNDSSPTTKVGLSYASHTWQIRTCNNYCCSSYASDTFVVTNSAPSAPNNTNFTLYNTTTSLTWDSGVDPDGDATYDEVSYQNGTTISNPATSPLNVTTTLLIKWRVRTCDSIGDCSDWVEEDSVTGTVVTVEADCPVCSATNETVIKKYFAGYGPGGIDGTAGSEGLNTELYCNGIPFQNTSLFRLNIEFGKNAKKINIYGFNYTLEDLEYCPWCYDGVNDYDETGIDCGGSCRSCTEAEVPGNNQLDNIEKAILAISTISLLGYVLSKTGVFTKLLSLLLGQSYGNYGIPKASKK